MAPPYSPGYLARSLVRVPGSGRDGPRATILCDLSRVSTLAATVPMPRNLPPALVSLPSGLSDNTLQNPRLRAYNSREGEYNASSPPSLHLQTSTANKLNGSSGKRTRDQVFQGDETYPKSKVSKLEDSPSPPRHTANVEANVSSSNSGPTITSPTVVVFIPRSQLHQFIPARQPQEERSTNGLQQASQTPEVLVAQLQESPAPQGVVAQLQSLLQQASPAPQDLVSQLQSLFQQASPAPQGVVSQLQSLLQHASPAPQGVVAQLQSLPQQASLAPQGVVAQLQSLLQQASPAPLGVVAQLQSLLQQSSPPPQKVAAPLQGYVQQIRPAPQIAVAPQQNYVQHSRPASQMVVAPQRSYLQQSTAPQMVVAPQQTNPTVQMQQTIKQKLQTLSLPNTVQAISMTEVVEESRQLREHNATLRRQLSLFHQLFNNKQRLASVAKRLGVPVA